MGFDTFYIIYGQSLHAEKYASRDRANQESVLSRQEENQHILKEEALGLSKQTIYKSTGNGKVWTQNIADIIKLFFAKLKIDISTLVLLVEMINSLRNLNSHKNMIFTFSHILFKVW